MNVEFVEGFIWFCSSQGLVGILLCFRKNNFCLLFWDVQPAVKIVKFASVICRTATGFWIWNFERSRD